MTPMRAKLMWLPIIIAVSAVAAVAIQFSHDPPGLEPDFVLPDVVLAAPEGANQVPFAGEAGMAAYATFRGSMNLTTIRQSLLSTVEGETGESIRGVWVGEANNGREDIHIYAESSGLIMAYLRRGLPSSRLVLLLNKSPEIYLSMALEDVARNLGGSIGPVAYWHFGFPSASHVVLGVADNNCEPTVRIPEGVTLHEASWAVVVDTQRQLDITIDGLYYDTVPSSAWAYRFNTSYNSFRYPHYFGGLAGSLFSEGKTPNIKITSSGNCPGEMAVVLVYSTN